MHRIFILGPQGSGKGTQARKLSETLGIPELSMGDLLRSEMASGSELGEKVKQKVNGGSLVSDKDASAVLAKRLTMPDTKDGYILDGFPRNLEQMKAFESFEQPTAVVVIHIPRDISVSRLLKRAAIENRIDDTEEVINKRLDIYEKDTVPIIEEYRKQGIVRDVDGTGNIDEIAANIKKLFVL